MSKLIVKYVLFFSCILVVISLQVFILCTESYNSKRIQLLEYENDTRERAEWHEAYVDAAFWRPKLAKLIKDHGLEPDRHEYGRVLDDANNYYFGPNWKETMKERRRENVRWIDNISK